ncbi:MAG: hypothetical protein SNJ75_03110 [Gemmataceae bacterium]
MRHRLLACVLALPWLLLAQSPTPPQAEPTSSPPSPSIPSPRRFDPETLRLRGQQGRWILYEGDRPLKDFGFVEADARQALRLIRDLNLNEYGLIGSPRPVMEYWLCDGKAPTGINRQGLRVLPLDSEHLTVAKQFGQWALKDRVRVLLLFPTEAEARQALAVFQTYRFTQVGLLGQGVPSMTLFFGPSEFRAAVQPNSRQLNAVKPPIRAKSAKAAKPSEKPMTPIGGGEAVVNEAIPALALRSTTKTNLPANSQSLWQRSKPTWRSESKLAGPVITPIEPDATGRVAHDYRNIQLRQDRGEWSLVVGSQLVASFGPHAADARLAQSALRYYRCTEHYRLGGTFASRWVPVAPSSPSGVMFGLSAIHLDPGKLEVIELSGQYALAEAGQVKLVVGPQAAEARELLEMMQRYQTDRVCRVGKGPEAMAFLVRSRPYSPKKEQKEQPEQPVAPAQR